MTYRQAITYLNNFVNYEKKDSYSYQKSFRLERVEGFLRLLGNPQDGLKCLHIAGTKGKGSVCVFAANILRAAGYRVGLYTSPHLSDVRERIRVLERTKDVRHKALADARQSTVAGEGQRTRDDFEGMISRRELAGLVERIKPAIGKYNRVYKDEALTFFEVFTALAFLYFKEKKVDYAVLETGLGGRLDATNVACPLVCGITPISYDHTQYLGNTLKQIAGEKAGIIKRQKAKGSRKSGIPPNIRQWAGKRQNLVVISAAQEREAWEVIRKRCVQKKARLYEIGRDIAWRESGLGYRRPNHGPLAWGFKSGLQSFDLQGIKQRYNNLKIRLLGKHQLANAALAVGMVEALGDEKIKPAHIRRGLKEARWPGRLEVVSRNPYIVLDGAQNAASALALKEAIKDNFRGFGNRKPNHGLLASGLGYGCGYWKPHHSPLAYRKLNPALPARLSAKPRAGRHGLMASYQRLILVLGMSRDKDISGVCRQFSDFCRPEGRGAASNSRSRRPEGRGAASNSRSRRPEGRGWASNSPSHDIIILTKSTNPRAAHPLDLAGYFSGKEIVVADSVKKALSQAKAVAKKEDLILITGSLFVVGEARARWAATEGRPYE